MKLNIIYHEAHDLILDHISEEMHDEFKEDKLETEIWAQSWRQIHILIQSPLNNQIHFEQCIKPRYHETKNNNR